MKITIAGKEAIVVLSAESPLALDGSNIVSRNCGEWFTVQQFDSASSALTALKKIGAKIEGGTTTVIIDDL